jgi:hypothetical protein
MATITDDYSHIEYFKQIAGPKLDPDHAPLEIFSWSPNGGAGIADRSIGTTQLDELAPAALRIIFAPQDYHHPHIASTILALVRRYEIPPAFILESVQSVTHSFGHRKREDGVDMTWFHFLSKNITPSTGEQDHNPTFGDGDCNFHANRQSHADYTWIRSSYFLRVEPKTHGTTTQGQNVVTLLCFGASGPLISRFRSLLTDANWSEGMNDPYSLVSIVLNDLTLQVDLVAWDLAQIFREVEKV